MRITTLVLITLLSGCGKKGESQKMRDIYHCWEMGWQLVDTCDKRGGGDCATWAADWFESNATGVTTLDPNAAFMTDKEKCARTTGLTTWNQLSAEDISDDMADALQALQAAVKKQDLPAIRAARSRVRTLLDLP